MKRIELTRGLFAIVDDEDFDSINSVKWYAVTGKGKRTSYAIRRNTPRGSKPDRELMHRRIVAVPPGFLLDHVDGDGLNNRKANLRVCTSAQNLRNKPSYNGALSRFKGVNKSGRANKPWRAQIGKDYKTIHIGVYRTEEEAAKAYDAKARELFGEFAWTNFGA